MSGNSAANYPVAAAPTVQMNLAPTTSFQPGIPPPQPRLPFDAPPAFLTAPGQQFQAYPQSLGSAFFWGGYGYRGYPSAATYLRLRGK